MAGIALIDADIVAHRVSYTTDNEEWGIAKYRTDEMLESIINDIGADQYRLYLSDTLDNNFRYHICQDYKANRILKVKPKHHEEIKAYMITDWDAVITYGQEADDALGIEQMAWDGGETTICSIDKDLHQIPGNHYNFVKKEQFFQDTIGGIRHFYSQILIGDNGDNIQGCPKIGVVRASKLLGELGTEAEMLRAVVECYRKQCPTLSPDQIQSRILLAGQLLYIRKKEGEIWTIPDLQVSQK